MIDSAEKVRELFANARELTASERTGWLDQNCGDERIRREVEELLRFDIDDAFLEQPLVAPIDCGETQSFRGGNAATSMLFAERYKLLQPIGEGGFGVVYMADQTKPVRRRVAIKLLRSSLNNNSALARFESERQALAMMEHPNIAKVFDGGVTEDGTPYFVMELVNGVPITTFCDANQLTNAQRMTLLMSVCNAVQHAHQKGIIHRDLKPSNVLVSLLDGTPIPKVIDFGIAKSLHGPLTDRTLFTSFLQMIGTPEYMSPEQAETSILDVDTRSDVFSLGVMAYELLTGTTPFDSRSLRKLAFADIQRTIREVDPPKPSDRVSTLGEQAVLIASKHGLSRTNMHKAIRGDLDWIVMKAMEKDRNRRYGSAQSLADDLNRWVNQEPIAARPPSFWYRSTKLLRKHRTTAAVAMVLTLAAFLSAIGFGYGLSEKNASLQRQKDAAERTNQIQMLADLEADRNKSLRYGNAMVAANESFRSGRRGTTMELLADCPEDKRGVEWNWLSYLAADRSELLMQGSSGHEQKTIAFDGIQPRLYSAGDDGMLRLWDTNSNQEMQSWRIDDEGIVAMEISQTDQRLLLCTATGRVVIWDTTTGQTTSTSQQAIKPSVAAVFDSNDPEYRQFAVGTDGGEILTWRGDLSRAAVRFEDKTQPFEGALQTLQFSADGSRLLAAGKGGIALFSTETGETLEKTGLNWQNYGALFVNELGRIVLYGPPLTTIDATSLNDRNVIEVPSTGIWAGAYVSSDRSLILATQDQSLRRINLENGVQETLAYFHSGKTIKLAVAGDGNALAITDESGSLRILKRNAFASAVSLQAFTSEISSIAADEGSEVYCLSDQGEVVCWDSDRDIELSRTPTHTFQGFSLALNSKKSTLISNGLDQRLVMRSTTSPGDPVKEHALALGARYIALHPDGKHLAGPMPRDLGAVVATGLNLDQYAGSNLAYWNLETGRVERCFAKLTNWAMKLRFSGDGKMLAAATISDGAVIWQLDEAEPIKLITENMPQVDDVAFSVDAKYLFAAYHNGQVCIWNLQTRALERKIVCHADQISGLLVTSDGTRIITASSSDQTLRVWDWRSGQKVAEFDSGMIGVSELKFVDNQHSLLVGFQSGRICRIKIASD